MAYFYRGLNLPTPSLIRSMKNERLYTLGEIHRLGLLKSHTGEPYKHKATISRIMSRMKMPKGRTLHGMGYRIPMTAIRAHNKRMRALAQ